MSTEVTAPVWEIARRSYLSAWRAWNTALDGVFYDVGSLSAEERSWLSSYASPEGSVLVVHPGTAKQPIRSLTPVDFVREQDQTTDDGIKAVAVAGVGSSAVGTAALARNVADYLDGPVAGIVAGLGLADVLAEALGGWFVLGARNTVRHTFAKLFDAYEMKDHVRDPESHRDMKEHFTVAGIDRDRFIYGSPDSTTLLYLLSKLGGRIKLLVGHSKGNYSIENALEGWLASGQETGSPVRWELRIVTLGAVIWFPSAFPHLSQFLGRIDYFGMLNSRLFVQRIDVPGAWHSTNAALPGHLSVAAALEAIDTVGGGLPPARTPGHDSPQERPHPRQKRRRTR